MLKKYIENFLNKLGEREKQIIIGRFGIDGSKPRTLEELGKTLGFSKERIRQIESSALKKLRNSEEIHLLKDYLS